MDRTLVLGAPLLLRIALRNHPEYLFIDVAIPSTQRAPIQFTFFWTEQNRWEGRDYGAAPQ